MRTVVACALSLLATASCMSMQEVSYRIVGDVDPDGSLYVSSDAKMTAEGFAPVYTWIAHPAQSGTVRVKTLDPQRTYLGYVSENRLPVDGRAADGTVELVLLPRDAANGVECDNHELRLHGDRFHGLKLEHLVPDASRFEVRISAEPGIELFDTLPPHTFSVYKRGKQLQSIERMGNFVLTDGTSTYLLGIDGWRGDGSSVLLILYRQPRSNDPYLLRDPGFYEEQRQSILENKSTK